MAPLTNKKTALHQKIATLQLRLEPLIPLPEGPAHPAFPRTLMDYHLLTEDELDSIAHHYHQSTPGPWSQHYPASMSWDKDFLARPEAPSMSSNRRQSASTKQNTSRWLDELMQNVKEMQETSFTSDTDKSEESKSLSVPLSDRDRVRIKKRKVGKFIGLVGMETTVEEIADRILTSINLAAARSHERLGEEEENALRRRKVA